MSYRRSVQTMGTPYLLRILCNPTSRLAKALNGKSCHVKFAVPMVWREPTDHTTDCYVCLTKTAGIKNKTRNTIKYPNIPSAIRPVPLCSEFPVPIPPRSWTLDPVENIDAIISEAEPAREFKLKFELKQLKTIGPRKRYILFYLI